MISLCTVVLDKLAPFVNLLCESIIANTNKIDEIIINNVESTMPEKVWEEKGIRFMLLGGQHNLFPINGPTSFCAQHAYGLYQCVNKTKNNLVMLCDPDIFFYTNVDEFYLGLMEKYSLNLIGMSHPNSVSEAISFFPTVINCLFKKNELPPDDYPIQHNIETELHSTSKIKGKYWFPGCNDEKLRKSFPNPNGHYETGCNLYLWAKEKNWRWLSFQTADCHLYSTNFYKTNFKITEKFKKTKLLYHASLASGGHNRLEEFTKAYIIYKEELEHGSP